MNTTLTEKTNPRLNVASILLEEDSFRARLQSEWLDPDDAKRAAFVYIKNKYGQYDI